MNTVELGSLFQFIRNGMNIKQDKSGRGLPITRIETISNAMIDGTRVGFADLNEADCADWLLHPGDILFSHINSVEHIGKCAVYRGVPERLVHGMNLLCLRPDPAKLLSEFAKYLLGSPECRRQLSKYTKRAVNQASVAITDIKTIRVSLPTLAVQRRLAGILDKADAVRQKRQEALATADQYLASYFVSKFGNPVTNPKRWPTKPLAEYGVVTTGNTPSRAEPRYYGGTIEWIKSDNINTPSHFLTRATEGLSDEGKKVARVVPAGSTLVTCIAGSPDCVGNAALADRDVAFNQQINAVTPRTGVDRYFLYCLVALSKPLVQQSSTESMKGLVSKSKFEAVQLIDVPPAQQADFGKQFVRIHRALETHRSAVVEAEHLFHSLVQRAFRGEL